MPIIKNKITNGILRKINGQVREVDLKTAAKPKQLTDKQRLANYRGERADFNIENGK